MPLPSVIADFTFSIRASLAASTVTPGSTAPEVSFTTPVIALCARATVGANTSTASAATTKLTTLRVIRCLLQLSRFSTRYYCRCRNEDESETSPPGLYVYGRIALFKRLDTIAALGGGQREMRRFAARNSCSI